MEAREKILDAALQVFAEAGSRGATTRRIAEVAGVNEVTLFRQFGCKERLLHEALVRGSARERHEVLPKRPRAPQAELERWATGQLRELNAARSLIRRSIGEFEADPQVSATTCAGPNRVTAELMGYLTRLRDDGAVPPEADLEAAAALLMGAIFADAIGRDVMPERYPFSIEDGAHRYVRLVLRAISQ